MIKPHLIIFSKAPYYGGAKSRLAQGIGKVHANRLYRAMVRKVIRNVTGPHWRTVIAVTPDKDVRRSFSGVWPCDLTRLRQGQGSLSPRLVKAFNRKGPVVIIGTDAPQVRRRDIALAFRALKHNKAVFGPASDGGFWLIGMNGPVSSDVFKLVNWSTQTALEDVVGNIGGKVAYLRTLIDVDDVEALQLIRSAK